MKKLLIAAAAAALAGGAYSAPIVYKYSASVKFLNLKEVNVSFKVQGNKVSAKVYKKVKDSTKLKGWLIMDEDGVTSKTVSGGLCESPSDGTFSLDYGRNRGFLVVVNTKAKANVKNPKILPAVLDAKWIDTEFAKLGTAKSGLAEGTLFLGGDTIAAVRPHLEFANGTTTHAEILTDETSKCNPAKAIPGYVAFSDYVWTSIYLFGQYNGPNWYVDNTAGVFAFADFEEAWDQNLPATLQRGYDDDPEEYDYPQNAFHDTWMNGAGLGKWKLAGDVTEGEYCCGLQPDVTYGDKYLDSLSGNLKGGLYLCTENGILVGSKYYQWFYGIEWEDQFVCCRDTTGQLTYKYGWQNDLWQDGAYEQETTDVIFGSWTITYNAKFGIKTAKELTEEEITDIWGAVTTPSMLMQGFWAYLKGAYLDLGGAKGRFYDKSEIYTKSVKDRFNVPMLTPQFVTYYGLY